MKTLKVLYLEHTAEPGGAQLALLRLAAEGRRSDPGFSPIYVPLVDGPLLDEWSKLARVDRRLIKADGPGGRAAPKWLVLRRLAHELEVDFVHANSPRTHLLAGMSCFGSKARVIMHIRDAYTPSFFGRTRSAGLRLMTRLLPATVLANSEFTLSESGARRGTVLASPAGGLVPASRAFRADGMLKICIVGRMDWWKGHADGLRAVALAVSSDLVDVANMSVDIVGDDTQTGKGQFDSLKNLCGELGLTQIVTFHGWLAPGGTLDIISESDVLLHLPTEPEPLGQVVIEAMSRDTLVVTYAAGGPESLVEYGAAGILCDPADIAGVGEMLTLLAAGSMDSEAHRLVAAARQASTKFAPEVIWAEYRRVLDECIMSRQAGSG